MTEVIGYTTSQLIEAMGKRGIHCSLAGMKEFAIELQQRALAQFTSANGVAETEQHDETEGSSCD